MARTIYPTSDKVDDEAFHAGLILEESGDYLLALDIEGSVDGREM